MLLWHRTVELLGGEMPSLNAGYPWIQSVPTRRKRKKKHVASIRLTKSFERYCGSTHTYTSGQWNPFKLGWNRETQGCSFLGFGGLKLLVFSVCLLSVVSDWMFRTPRAKVPNLHPPDMKVASIKLNPPKKKLNTIAVVQTHTLRDHGILSSWVGTVGLSAAVWFDGTKTP